jgi:hypothetical protein
LAGVEYSEAAECCLYPETRKGPRNRLTQPPSHFDCSLHVSGGATPSTQQSSRRQLVALRESYEIVERTVPNLIRKHASSGALTGTSAEVLTAQLQRHLIEGITPQAYRGAFLVALWSIYESAVVLVGENIQRLCPDCPSVPRAAGWLDKIVPYFATHLGFPMLPPESSDIEHELRMFQRVRHVLMHASGMKETTREKDWRRIEDYARGRTDITVEGNYLAVSDDFDRDRFDLIGRSLRHVVDSGRKKLADLGIA